MKLCFDLYKKKPPVEGPKLFMKEICSVEYRFCCIFKLLYLDYEAEKNMAYTYLSNGHAQNTAIECRMLGIKGASN